MVLAVTVFLVLLALAVPGARAVVRRYATRTESGTGLALFRMLYGVVLLCEVAQYLRGARLISDPLPYLVPGSIAIESALVAWLAVILMLICGLFTRAAAVANYAFGIVFLSGLHGFEYHVDYILVGTNLLLIFAPVSRRLSLDARLRRTPPEPVSALWSRLFVFVGIALVYLDSVFYKWTSPMWTAGLGVWKPASVVHTTWVDLSPLLDLKWLMLGLGYATLVFETLFPFLMWFDRLRWPLLGIGLGLHLGITLAFPIPWFGLTVVALYVLLVPPRVWDALDRKLGVERDREATLHLPRTRLLAFTAVFALFLFSQGASIIQSGVPRMLVGAGGTSPSWRTTTRLCQKYTGVFAQPYLGVTRHSVFMDHHFRGHEHIVTLVYVDSEGTETWLPLYKQNGQVDPGNTGRFWVEWNFRVVGPRIDQDRLADGIRRRTAFWARRNGVSLEDARFRVLVKSIEIPGDEWEEGFLRRQLEQPWHEAGAAHWSRGECRVTLAPIEAVP
ncbi:MAG: HTTM domain-containing protein [Planctomycetota bacterium]|nr:HTTM domain-containing protein [Planctomycetota bacterium]